MRVAIYPRVSREEQVQGYSLDAQLEACRAYAAAHGWEIVAEFVEPGLTGTNDRRPAFQTMIAAALDGQFEIALVHKFDRLARNRADAVLYKRLLREKGVSVVSATEPGQEDGPAGMLVEGMLEVVAEWYSINLSTEVRKGLRRKAANGEQPGGILPLGYHRDPGNSWVTVTEMGAQICEAFQEFATGQYSLRSWAKEAYERGYRSRAGNKIPPSIWQNIFRNRFYVGVIVYDGAEYQGRHTPLVDEEVFMQVQQVLDSRPSGGHQRHKREYLLSGFLWSADYQVGMTGMTAKQRYRYYRAGRDGYPELLIREEVAESQIQDWLMHVIVADANLLCFPADLRLALQVSPNVGLIYQALPSPEARRMLLSGVVVRVLIEGQQVTGIKLRPGFEFESDKSESLDSNNPGRKPPPEILLSLIYADEVSHATA